jgi:hypothetical protein
MKQSNLASWIESITSTAVGFSISLAAQVVFLPMLGVTIAFHQNLVFAIIMTVISILRQFAMRRIFEHFGLRARMSAFVQAVMAERLRQKSVEGFDADHDAGLERGELAAAGAAYAKNASLHESGDYAANPRLFTPIFWPWSEEWWKPVGFRRDLVKAAALIIAEGEKFDANRNRNGGRR